MKTYDEQKLRDLVREFAQASASFGIALAAAAVHDDAEIRANVLKLKAEGHEAWNALDTYLKTGQVVSVPLSDEVLKGLDAAARLQ